MYIKIYFGDKPVFLCNELDETVEEYRHHPDAVFIDEISGHAIKSLLHEIAKEEFHAGILLHSNLDELRKVFFKHFTLITAAGGLVENEKGEYLLIYRRGKWDLPKGKLDPGETIEQCAVREVEEETGLQQPELKKLITITYHTYNEFGKHILKDSHWYKMKVKGPQTTKPQTEEDILEIKWVKKKEIEQYLNDTFPSIRDVLEKV
ncbi:NUDIX hydrolase [Lacibacter luteus]|uniref:NUDIX hydrolase n=1 Tax=Lacibacter luteus TaxID=2508719 RepID=A0A4Q1CG04_9BACT|nr:NUDIX hydrolase [Lacibacter luteus]RXK58929.1 NUDIX hydrolase [Lacibacter luteus]